MQRRLIARGIDTAGWSPWGLLSLVSAGFCVLQVLSIAVARAQAGVADGKYIDIVGGEDLYVKVKAGVIIGFDGCGSPRKPCPAKAVITASNPGAQAIRISVPDYKINGLALCSWNSAPQNVDWRSGEQYVCDFKRGWIKQP